jgi:hypothetical protein
MSKEIITTENDYVAFFTNDVTDFLTENLSETIKTAINDSILSGNLSPAIPIAVTVNSDTKEITLLNVMLEEVNLNVVPGSVILPSNYQPSNEKTSLVADPIWSAHMESVWGF